MRSKKHPATTHIPKAKARKRVVNKLPSYPRNIFIIRAQDRGGGEEWFQAYDDLAGLDDGDVIGIYELKEVRRVRVTTESGFYE